MILGTTVLWVVDDTTVSNAKSGSLNLGKYISHLIQITAPVSSDDFEWVVVMQAHNSWEAQGNLHQMWCQWTNSLSDILQDWKRLCKWDQQSVVLPWSSALSWEAFKGSLCSLAYWRVTQADITLSPLLSSLCYSILLFRWNDEVMTYHEVI